MIVIKVLTFCTIVTIIGTDALNFPILRKIYGKVRHGSKHRDRSKTKSSNNKRGHAHSDSGGYAQQYLRYDFNQNNFMQPFDFGDPYFGKKFGHTFPNDFGMIYNTKHKEGRSNHHKKPSRSHNHNHNHNHKKGGPIKTNKQNFNEFNFQHSQFNPPPDEYQKQLDEMHRSQAYINNLMGLDYNFPPPTTYASLYAPLDSNYPTFHTLTIPSSSFINPTQPTFGNFFNPDDFQNGHTTKPITQAEDFAALALKALKESGFNDFGGQIGFKERPGKNTDKDQIIYSSSNNKETTVQQQKINDTDVKSNHTSLPGTEDFFNTDLIVVSSQMPPFLRTNQPFLQGTFPPQEQKEQQDQQKQEIKDQQKQETKDQPQQNEEKKEQHQEKKQEVKQLKAKDIFKESFFDKVTKKSPAASLFGNTHNKGSTSYVEFLNHDTKFEYATQLQDNKHTTRNIIDADLNQSTTPQAFQYIKNSSLSPTSFTKVSISSNTFHKNKNDENDNQFKHKPLFYSQSSQSSISGNKNQIHQNQENSNKPTTYSPISHNKKINNNKPTTYSPIRHSIQINFNKPTTYSPIVHNLNIKNEVTPKTNVFVHPTNNILQTFPMSTIVTQTLSDKDNKNHQTNLNTYDAHKDEQSNIHKELQQVQSTVYKNDDDLNTSQNSRPIQLYNIRNESKVLRYSQPLHYIPVQNYYNNYNAYRAEQDNKLKPAYNQPFQYTLDNTNYVSSNSYNAQPAKPYGAQNESKPIYSQPYNVVATNKNYLNNNYNPYPVHQNNIHYQSKPSSMFSEPVQYTPTNNNVFDNNYNAPRANNANTIRNDSKPIQYSQPLPPDNTQENNAYLALQYQYNPPDNNCTDNITFPQPNNNSSNGNRPYSNSQILQNSNIQSNNSYINNNFSVPDFSQEPQYIYQPTNFTQHTQYNDFLSNSLIVNNNAKPSDGTTSTENENEVEVHQPLKILVPDISDENTTKVNENIDLPHQENLQLVQSQANKNQYQNQVNNQYQNQTSNQYQNHANNQYQNQANNQYQNQVKNQYQNQVNNPYQTQANNQYQNQVNNQYQNLANNQYQNQANNQYNIQYAHQPKYTEVSTQNVVHKMNPFNQNQINFNYNYFPKTKAIYSVPNYDVQENEVPETQNSNNNNNMVVPGNEVIKIVDASQSMLNNSYVNNNGWTPILFK